jgi:NitT/TauT family transport system substrate-binding protein
MARQLTPFGRLLLVVAGLSLVGYGLHKYGVLRKLTAVVAPDKKAEGTVSRDDFGTTSAAGTTEPAAATAASTGSGARLGRPIKVAIVTWGGYAGGIVANDGFAPNKTSLFFKEFGLEVEILLIEDFEKSRDAFRVGGDKGGVDIMWSTVDAFALEYGQLVSLKPKTILQYDWSRGGDAIAVDGTVKSVMDLKGKKVACAEGTPSHYFALYVLTQGGLTNRDVDWVFTASAIDAANVFKAGKVDAAVSWSPDVYTAANERPGARILASTREATNLIADIFVARGDFLDKHPEDARRFVAGWLKGVDLANRNPDRTAALLAKSFTGVDLEGAKGMLQDVKLPNFAENRAFFDP